MLSTSSEINTNGNKNNSLSNNRFLICKRAIFSGALVSIGVSFLLNLFNIGVGLSVLTYQNGTNSIGFGSFIWLVICAFIGMYITGYVAGMAALTNCKKTGMLHGFLAWSLGLIFLLILAILSLNFTNNNANFVISQPFISMLQPITQNPTITTTKTMATGTLAMFFIFLIGAIASCIGGYAGVKKMD